MKTSLMAMALTKEKSLAQVRGRGGGGGGGITEKLKVHVPSSVQYCAKVMQVIFVELRDLRLVLFLRNGGMDGREGEKEKEKERSWGEVGADSAHAESQL